MGKKEKQDDTDHPGMVTELGLGYYPSRIAAIEQLLIHKGIISEHEIQATVSSIDSRSPADGARVVARAWIDPVFKARLLKDPISAVAELGYEIPANMPRLDVVEDTNRVHHLIVCTLCSCYPRALLGRPPQWYKSFNYRARAISDPRGVMAEFGTVIPGGMQVKVLDSTADIRFLVLPLRPEGTDGMSEDELSQLVTRDSMIGVTFPRAPYVDVSM